MRIMVMLGAVLGFILLVVAFFSATTPGQAAWAAMACAVCIIPYVGWRASQIDEAEREQRIFREMVIDALDGVKPKS